MLHEWSTRLIDESFKLQQQTCCLIPLCSPSQIQDRFRLHLKAETVARERLPFSQAFVLFVLWNSATHVPFICCGCFTGLCVPCSITRLRWDSQFMCNQRDSGKQSSCTETVLSWQEAISNEFHHSQADLPFWDHSTVIHWSIISPRTLEWESAILISISASSHTWLWDLGQVTTPL